MPAASRSLSRPTNLRGRLAVFVAAGLTAGVGAVALDDHVPGQSRDAAAGTAAPTAAVAWTAGAPLLDLATIPLVDIDGVLALDAAREMAREDEREADMEAREAAAGVVRDGAPGPAGLAELGDGTPTRR